MATELKAKEVGASDSSSLTSSLPNDTDFGINWTGFGSDATASRKNAQIESEGSNSGNTLVIGSLGLNDCELRITGFDMKGLTSSAEGFHLYLIDILTGTNYNGYRMRFEPNRASTPSKFKLDRLDNGVPTEIDNTVLSGWSNTTGELIDFYLRTDGTTVTCRAVQSDQSLDETLSAADSTYDFGTGASEIDVARYSFRDTANIAATFEVWDMDVAVGGAQVIATML